MKSAFNKMCLAMTAYLMPLMGNVQGYDCSQPCMVYEDPCCATSPCCGTWIVSADLLYWRACEDGLICECDAADEVNFIDNGRTVSVVTAGDVDFKEHWDLGYRISLGYKNPNQWGFAAFWTHYHQNAKGKNKGENHSHWKLNVDVLDLVVARDFTLGSCFNVTPFAGLRGAWLKQKVRGHFIASETGILSESSSSSSSSSRSSSEEITFSTLEEKNKQDFWGVGPEIGIEADWKFGCGFSIYGGASAALLYGRYEVDFESEEVLTTATFIDNGKHHHCASQSVIDASLGLRWQKEFCNARILFLQLGWEHHRYFDFNQFGCSDDLSLDGLVFSGGIQF